LHQLIQSATNGEEGREKFWEASAGIKWNKNERAKKGNKSLATKPEQHESEVESTDRLERERTMARTMSERE